MTDRRLGERLWEAIDRLPIGDGGVVVRHYHLPPSERAVLAEEVGRVCWQRGLTLAIARDVELACRVAAGLVHHPDTIPDGLPFSRPVHDLVEAESAKRDGAALVFVSPLYATRSHPEARPLSRKMAKEIVRTAGCPAIALGGMDERKFVRAEKDGFYGWAAIDAWIRT